MSTGPSEAPPYLRTARSPRMLGLLVLLLAAAVVCGRLGAWQLDRAEIRGALAAEREAAERAAADPVPLDDALRPRGAFTEDLVGLKVRLTGEATGDEVLVAGRSPGDDRTGFLVLSGVRVVDGGSGDAGAGAVLPVARGWVADADAELGALPGGPVEIVGYLQGGEGASTAALPAGQVGSISPAQLVNRWGGPMYPAYLVLVDPAPSAGGAVEALPPPTDLGSGLNVQNVAYALQWWIFGGFAVLLWLRVVRDAARDAVVTEGDGPAPEGDDPVPEGDGPAPEGEDAVVPQAGDHDDDPDRAGASPSGPGAGAR